MTRGASRGRVEGRCPVKSWSLRTISHESLLISLSARWKGAVKRWAPSLRDASAVSGFANVRDCHRAGRRDFRPHLQSSRFGEWMIEAECLYSDVSTLLNCSRCVMTTLTQGDLPKDPGILPTVSFTRATTPFLWRRAQHRLQEPRAPPARPAASACRAASARPPRHAEELK
jgi:hypothetical protein